MNKEFYKKIRKEFCKSLKGNFIFLAHSGYKFQDSGDQDFPFSVNRNFYYLTGINQDNVILLIYKSKDGIKECLFVNENDPEIVKWVGATLYPEEATEISGVENVKFLEDFDSFMFRLLNPSRKNYEEFDTVYLDLERREDLPFVTWSFKQSSKFKNEYPELKIENAYNKIVKMRMIKHDEEVKKIQESINTTRYALENVLKNIKPGMYEYQIESYFDQYIKFDGQKPTSFKTICASGKNATVLHYIANNSKIGANDLVLFDLGCHTDYYISDISRTYPANGKFTERQKQIYEIVLECNKKCIEFIKPGLTWKEYNDFANALLIKGLKKIGLIKKDNELIKYYWHSVGHSIGLDTHDPTLSGLKFEPGMLTTVEPGLYIEEENIGIRIEDNVLITENGCINLSKDIIKEVKDIEDFMKKNNK